MCVFLCPNGRRRMRALSINISTSSLLHRKSDCEGIWGNLSLSAKRLLKFMSNFLSHKHKHLEGSSAAESQLTTKHPRSIHHSTSYCFTSSLQCANLVKDNYQNRYSLVGPMNSTMRQRCNPVIKLELTV